MKQKGPPLVWEGGGPLLAAKSPEPPSRERSNNGRSPPLFHKKASRLGGDGGLIILVGVHTTRIPFEGVRQRYSQYDRHAGLLRGRSQVHDGARLG